jgi:hypothetical protein
MYKPWNSCTNYMKLNKFLNAHFLHLSNTEYKAFLVELT